MRAVFFFLFLIYSTCVLAQENPKVDTLSTYYDLSLDELKKIKASGVSSELEKLINSLIGVASQKSLSSRESPSIVSLITEDEIKKSGARDLIDVLKLVPGFDFAYDGESSIGVGFRGNWVNEGKILLLMDGIEMNEIFSANLSFGNHYSVANISRIEIIRGPGSAIYGGFAEFGVINIITKKGAEINGAYGQLTNGQMRNSLARRNIEFGVGKKIKDFDFSLTGIVGQGNRSDRDSFINTSFTSTNLTGLYKSLGNNSSANPSMFLLKTQYKDLSAKFIYDNYETAILTYVDTNQNRFLTKSSPSFFSELKYKVVVTSKFSITPRLSFIDQAPKTNGLPDTLRISQNQGSRLRSSVIANYDPHRKLNIVGGAEFFYDYAKSSNDSIQTINGSVPSISYNNYALFTQITGKNRLANLIVGGRYDKNSKFGEAFVPRLGVTKRINQFHFKLLYSGSFRAPTIQNIAKGTNSARDFILTGNVTGLKPEKTTIVELETGYQFTRDILATVNLFSTSTSNPIVYSSELGIYSNFDKSGSKGIEAEIKIKKQWGYLTGNYSYYTVSGESKIDAYTTKEIVNSSNSVPDGAERNDASLLAFPAHKFSIAGSLKLTNKLSLNPSVNFNGTRYGYEPKQEQSNYSIELKTWNPAWITNINLSYEKIVKGLNASIAANNLFNTEFNYLTPYYSKNGSLPSTSREIIVRLSYNLNF